MRGVQRSRGEGEGSRSEEGAGAGAIEGRNSRGCRRGGVKHTDARARCRMMIEFDLISVSPCYLHPIILFESGV